MMIALLVAGIGLLLAGLLAIGFGIPVKEFSFGNTLILAGAIAACTGMILLGLWIGRPGVEEYRAAARLRRSPPDAAYAQPRRSLPAPARSSPPTTTDSRSAATSRRRRRRPAEPCAVRRRHGRTRPRRAIADAPRRRRCRSRAAPRRPSRGAICCFPRHRGRSASAPQARAAEPSADPTFAPSPPPRRRLPNRTSRRRRPSTMPGRNRNAQGRRTPPLPRRSARAPSTFTETDAGAAGPIAIRRPPPQARSSRR